METPIIKLGPRKTGSITRHKPVKLEFNEIYFEGKRIIESSPELQKLIEEHNKWDGGFGSW